MIGLVVGAAAVLAWRPRNRRPEPRAEREEPTRLPPGVASVLSVLPSSAVVIDHEDRVLRASSAARAFGLVKGEQLVVGELIALARQVRRDGEIRETEIDVPNRKFGGRTTSFAVRVAPLGQFAGGGLVLVLADDQTESRRVEAVRRDFVANVSHELKTPVGALALLAEATEEAAKDPEAVDRCRMKASKHGITLVSGGDGDLSVLGDEDMLVTALRNLIENAIAYSPERTRVV